MTLLAEALALAGHGLWAYAQALGVSPVHDVMRPENDPSASGGAEASFNTESTPPEAVLQVKLSWLIESICSDSPTLTSQAL
eukprot:COSAG01_NODE_2895_length_6901_cov_35.009262_2_plen_82_part_00